MSIKKAHKLKKGAQLLIVQLGDDEDESASLPGSYWLSKARINVDGVQRKEINQLLKKSKHCFPEKSPLQLPPEQIVDHEIRVDPESTSPSRPTFRLSQPKMDELKKQLEEVLSHGFIEESSSPYGPPVFFVKKKRWITLLGMRLEGSKQDNCQGSSPLA